MNDSEKEDYYCAVELRTDRLRKSQGMREIKRGERKCLSCERKFISDDISAIRLCDVCRARSTEY